MLAPLRRCSSGRAGLVGVLAGLLAIPGCAYESAYMAPSDGRARAVWKENDVVVELSAAPASIACLEQLRAWSDDGRLRLATGDLERESPPPSRFRLLPRAGVWVPVYYGAPLVASAPGVPPLLPRPVIFSPSLALARTTVGWAGSSATSSFAPAGGGLGKIIVVLAVVALVVLPIVDIVIAAAPPEGDRSSDAIDQVNVFNDLARMTGSPCSYGIAP